MAVAQLLLSSGDGLVFNPGILILLYNKFLFLATEKRLPWLKLHNNLGLALMRQGEPEGAIGEYRVVLTLKQGSGNSTTTCRPWRAGGMRRERYRPDGRG